MNKDQAHAVIYSTEPVDRRKIKRAERVLFLDNLYDAYCQGQWARAYTRINTNPYPPGKRHDEWNLGWRHVGIRMGL